MRKRLYLSGMMVFLVAGCAAAQVQAPEPVAPNPAPKVQPAEGEPLFPDPFPSTYKPFPSKVTLIRNATIFTGTGQEITGGSILLRDGKVAEIGRDITAPADALVIDATGKWVTPGVIDPHSHLGVYPAPGIPSLSDGNEATSPNTAQVWAEHSIWPQDPGFGLALAGGVTALHTLPGSANLIGGRSVTVKPVPSRTYQGLKFPGAPHGLKMACGENPKRVYETRGPATRMANVAGWRTYFSQAQDYLYRWKKWKAEGSDPEKKPTRDLALESLAATLNGDMDAHWHCYRGDEMVTALDIAREFGFSIASFEHAVEGYKIRDYLEESGVCALMWSDWWGFKLEAYDGIKENIGLVHQSGACAVIHSDDAQIMQFLNLDAAKALHAANEAGIPITKAEAVSWFPSNAAKAIGIDDVTGSLEVGKNADVVIWSGDPFSIYTKTEKVFVDGALLFDRAQPNPYLYGDFMLGIRPGEVIR
ncbi:MAG: amidohydrolase [Longimicrobiales bacterium]|nr:amidohydrolase [Longimicrobiales bacterium]